MATTTETIQETPAQPSEPFFKKYAGWIILGLAVALTSFIIYTVSHKSGTTSGPTVTKRDTVTGSYLVAPLGQIVQGTILKDHLLDGTIMYEVPMGVDTAKGPNNQPIMDTTKGPDGKVIMDTVAHKPQFHLRLTTRLEYRFPKYVQESTIAPR